MTDEARLLIEEFNHQSWESMTCTVRCLSGVLRVGDPVRLTAPATPAPIVDGLTIAKIFRYRDVSFIDLGMTARVTVTGTGRIDVAAIRKAAAGVPADQAHRLGFLLVAS